MTKRLSQKAEKISRIKCTRITPDIKFGVLAISDIYKIEHYTSYECKKHGDFYLKNVYMGQICGKTEIYDKRCGFIELR